jgi:hypothetical protein
MSSPFLSDIVRRVRVIITDIVQHVEGQRKLGEKPSNVPKAPDHGIIMALCGLEATVARGALDKEEQCGLKTTEHYYD